MKKRVLFIFMALMVTFAGCSKNEAKDAAVENAEASNVETSDIKASEYIKLGEYKGLEIASIDTTVTDEDVDNEIELLRKNDATLEEVTDRDVIEVGDTANIDFKGMKDGVAFDGGTSEGFDLEIGSGSFIPGFEDGLVGVRVGETVNLDLTFPENYQAEDLAGQAVVFEVKVNSIKEKVLPEVTDEFISEQTNNECKSVADYKERLKKTLEDERVRNAEMSMKNEVLSLVNESSEVVKDIPQEYLDEKAEYLKENAENYAKSYNVDLETYVSQAIGLSMDEFEERCKDQAKEIAKESLVTMAIAEAENITVSDDEMNDKIKEYVEAYGYESEEQFKEGRDMEQFKEYLVTDKVAQFLIDNAKIVSDSDK